MNVKKLFSLETMLCSGRLGPEAGAVPREEPPLRERRRTFSMT